MRQVCQPGLVVLEARDMQTGSGTARNRNGCAINLNGIAIASRKYGAGTTQPEIGSNPQVDLIGIRNCATGVAYWRATPQHIYGDRIEAFPCLAAIAAYIALNTATDRFASLSSGAATDSDRHYSV